MPLIAFIYSFTQVLFPHIAESSLWDERKQASARIKNQQMAFQSYFSPALMPKLNAILPTPIEAYISPIQKKLTPSIQRIFSKIDTRVCRISKTTFPPTSRLFRGVVIHIQDVHQNEEAQKNIASVLTPLMNESVINTLALEGAFNKHDFLVLRRFPQREAIQNAADFLLHEGFISGPVRAYWNLDPSSNVNYAGIDDKELHSKNVQAYLDSCNIKESIVKKLSVIHNSLIQKKSKVFSIDFLKADSVIENFHIGKTSLFEVVNLFHSLGITLTSNLKKFYEASIIEKNLNWNRVEQERSLVLEKIASRLSLDDMNQLRIGSLALQEGQITHRHFYELFSNICLKKGYPLTQYPALETYVKYITLAESINASDLFLEAQKEEKFFYEKYAQTPEEETLIKQSQEERWLKKLVQFELTRSEWERQEKSLSLPLTREEIFPFLSFYESALKRDLAMGENVNKLATSEKESIIALVTGGFHTDGLTSHLTSDGWVVITLTPKLTKIGSTEASSYLSVFASEHTPLEKLYRGEKLFLSGDPKAGEAFMPTLVTGYMFSTGARGSAPTDTFNNLEPTVKAESVSVKPTNDGIEVKLDFDETEIQASITHDQNKKITGFKQKYFHKVLTWSALETLFQVGVIHLIGGFLGWIIAVPVFVVLHYRKPLLHWVKTGIPPTLSFSSGAELLIRFLLAFGFAELILMSHSNGYLYAFTAHVVWNFLSITFFDEWALMTLPQKNALEKLKKAKEKLKNTPSQKNALNVVAAMEGISPGDDIDEAVIELTEFALEFDADIADLNWKIVEQIFNHGLKDNDKSAKSDLMEIINKSQSVLSVKEEPDLHRITINTLKFLSQEEESEWKRDLCVALLRRVIFSIVFSIDIKDNVNAWFQEENEIPKGAESSLADVIAYNAREMNTAFLSDPLNKKILNQWFSLVVMHGNFENAQTMKFLSAIDVPLKLSQKVKDALALELENGVSETRVKLYIRFMPEMVSRRRGIEAQKIMELVTDEMEKDAGSIAFRIPYTDALLRVLMSEIKWDAEGLRSYLGLLFQAITEFPGRISPEIVEKSSVGVENIAKQYLKLLPNAEIEQVTSFFFLISLIPDAQKRKEWVTKFYEAVQHHDYAPGILTVNIASEEGSGFLRRFYGELINQSNFNLAIQNPAQSPFNRENFYSYLENLIRFESEFSPEAAAALITWAHFHRSESNFKQIQDFKGLYPLMFLKIIPLLRESAKEFRNELITDIPGLILNIFSFERLLIAELHTQITPLKDPWQEVIEPHRAYIETNMAEAMIDSPVIIALIEALESAVLSNAENLIYAHPYSFRPLLQILSNPGTYKQQSYSDEKGGYEIAIEAAKALQKIRNKIKDQMNHEANSATIRLRKEIEKYINGKKLSLQHEGLYQAKWELTILQYLFHDPLYEKIRGEFSFPFRMSYFLKETQRGNADEPLLMIVIAKTLADQLQKKLKGVNEKNFSKKMSKLDQEALELWPLFAQLIQDAKLALDKIENDPALGSNFDLFKTRIQNRLIDQARALLKEIRSKEKEKSKTNSYIKKMGDQLEAALKTPTPGAIASPENMALAKEKGLGAVGWREHKIGIVGFLLFVPVYMGVYGLLINLGYLSVVPPNMQNALFVQLLISTAIFSIVSFFTLLYKHHKYGVLQKELTLTQNYLSGTWVAWSSLMMSVIIILGATTFAIFNPNLITILTTVAVSMWGYFLGGWIHSKKNSGATDLMLIKPDSRVQSLAKETLKFHREKLNPTNKLTTEQHLWLNEVTVNLQLAPTNLGVQEAMNNPAYWLGMAQVAAYAKKEKTYEFENVMKSSSVKKIKIGVIHIHTDEDLEELKTMTRLLWENQLEGVAVMNHNPKFLNETQGILAGLSEEKAVIFNVDEFSRNIETGLYTYDDVLKRAAERGLWTAKKILDKSATIDILVVTHQLEPFGASENLVQMIHLILNLGQGWAHMRLEESINASHTAQKHA
ncbi:MAG: hypothetical protein ACKVQC_00510 [Elusimicrobiota bacterium]